MEQTSKYHLYGSRKLFPNIVAAQSILFEFSTNVSTGLICTLSVNTHLAPILSERAPKWNLPRRLFGGAAVSDRENGIFPAGNEKQTELNSPSQTDPEARSAEISSELRGKRQGLGWLSP